MYYCVQDTMNKNWGLFVERNCIEPVTPLQWHGVQVLSFHLPLLLVNAECIILIAQKLVSQINLNLLLLIKQCFDYKVSFKIIYSKNFVHVNVSEVSIRHCLIEIWMELENGPWFWFIGISFWWYNEIARYTVWKLH